MTDLMRYATMLDDGDRRRPPPVDKWTPSYCGEMDLTIRRDGVWVHDGTPIGRARLVRLLSTIIRKEGDRYFLVTPVEKLGIKVEDAPFLAVLMRVEGEGDDRRLVFTTNVGDDVIAGPGHRLDYRASAFGKAPYIHVRAGLDALISRAVFYDLAAIGETRDIDGDAWFGVRSAGEFFAFGRAGDIFAAHD